MLYSCCYLYLNSLVPMIREMRSNIYKYVVIILCEQLRVGDDYEALENRKVEKR